MDETLAPGVGAGAGGAPLSPLSILLLVLAFQFLDRYLELLKKKGSKSNEETQLRLEIKNLLKEASGLSTPSTFAQAAKLRRMATAKEKELIKKQEERSKEQNFSYSLYNKILMGVKVPLYAGLCWRFWGIPIAAVPQHLLQPFGRILSWKAGDPASGFIMIGIIPWLILTSRVTKFLCQKFLTKITPEIDWSLNNI
ncbi:guided entry of tail-anchored proteins factor 1 [Dioscorea cayenensis subsp. rotundata]|uniref:Guided entry of tail-anchored proteins factor 1 n=1 Tax=Dioscorea cayennensis subsp. rotundata TaxID=55577 RepID=A0AB40C6I2_DIOCR|nr:guided entry of tail-anchored proteins factor 1 [Dioscorea cayenensis subsp. rotundata]